MSKIISLMFVFLFSLTLISATTIYSGESYELELEQPYEYYSIVGNSTAMDLEITQNGNLVTITTDKYMQEDSFEIIFFDSEKETITVYESSGGGSTKTVYRDINITKYIDKEITKYVDRDVPGETIEVEKVVTKVPFWAWIIIVVLAAIIIGAGFSLKRKEPETQNIPDTVEREDEKDE